MGWWKAITSALEAGRRRGKGQLSIGGALAMAAGALLAWLAGRRRAVPTVRATGVAENAPRTVDGPPPPP